MDASGELNHHRRHNGSVAVVCDVTQILGCGSTGVWCVREICRAVFATCLFQAASLIWV